MKRSRLPGWTDSGIYLRLEISIEQNLRSRPIWQPKMYRKVTAQPNP